MSTQYMIVVRNQLGQWTLERKSTAEYIGGTPAENTFDTEAEAWDAIAQLRKVDGGGNGWGELEADVQEIDEYA